MSKIISLFNIKTKMSSIAEQQCCITSQTMSSSKATRVEKTEMLPHIASNNALILQVWAEKGVEEAVKQMFVHPEDGSVMGYAEMRTMYG
jgi:hypothetical protein